MWSGVGRTSRVRRDRSVFVVVSFVALALTFLATRGPATSSFLYSRVATVQLAPALDDGLGWLGRAHMSSAITFPSGFQQGVFGVRFTGSTFMLVETAMLLFLELLPKLTSNFVSRKICHAGTGVLTLTLDSRQADARAAMWIITFSSIAMTWNLTKAVGIKPFRFGAEKDVGITIYLCLVTWWFYAQLPLAALSPMFFADPAGAVVGKFLTRNGFPNRTWYLNKTVGGSAAVLLVTAATLLVFYPPMPAVLLAGLSVGAVVAEALGGQYDNLFLAGVVIGSFWYFG